MFDRLRFPALGLCVCFTLIGADRSAAQNAIPSVVQLPSFQTFSYSGTVVVPDSGSTYLGGVKRSATGINRRGLSHGFGSAQGVGQASVTATIIDHHEIDRRLRGSKPQDFLPARTLTRPPLRAADLRRPSDPTEEGKALVRFARAQYLRGNESDSFDTYQMAIGVLSGRLKELAKAEFRRVFSDAADQALRTSTSRRR